MRNRTYKIFSGILLGLSLILFITFIVLSIAIYNSLPKLPMRLTSYGITNFLEIFSPSIKFGAASVIIFTLWLTLKRMQQTQIQIDINQENVKFNNFYKHKEEFSGFLDKSNLIKIVKSNSSIGVESLIPAVYAYFFNSSYKTFKPKMNEGAEEEVNQFLQQLNNSVISNENTDLKMVSIEEIKILDSRINRTIDPICRIISEIWLGTVRNHIKHHGGDLAGTEEKFRALSNIFCAKCFYEDFLAFDGVNVIRKANFVLNYRKYSANYGL